MNEKQFLGVSWPSEFEVELTDGRRETLLRGDGVMFSSASDDPEGKGFITATLPRPKSNKATNVGRVHYLDEIARIVGIDSTVIWERDIRNLHTNPRMD